jgi:hypothetical protein
MNEFRISSVSLTHTDILFYVFSYLFLIQIPHFNRPAMVHKTISIRNQLSNARPPTSCGGKLLLGVFINITCRYSGRRVLHFKTLDFEQTQPLDDFRNGLFNFFLSPFDRG